MGGGKSKTRYIRKRKPIRKSKDVQMCILERSPAVVRGEVKAAG